MNPVTLPSATGIGSPLRIEVREDIGVVWVESWSTESTNRAWSNPKLDDLLDALGAVRKPRTVTTAAELNALPEGSIVRDRSGLALQRSILGWNCINGVRDIRREELERDAFPATVLHEGGAS